MIKSNSDKPLGQSLELYKKLCLIRKTEEKIAKHYHEDEMKTPVHSSMGQEAIVVGVCSALKKEDHAFGSYRGHGIYLAKTQNTDDFFAEMFGKVTSPIKGIGGSMHMCAPDYGVMQTSAIVASNIPVAVGTAFANKQMKNDKITVVFFGDGALDEGVFWESLNVSCLMKLPILFVCEDNGLAVHTHKTKRQGYKSILDIVSNYNCHVLNEDTTDVEVIHGLTTKAIELIRSTQQPCFIHLKYYRYLEHVGVNKDFDAGYRSKEEFEEWFKKDPIKIQRDKLIQAGYKEKDIEDMEEQIAKKINQSFVLAQKAPYPDEEELLKEVI